MEEDNIVLVNLASHPIMFAETFKRNVSIEDYDLTSKECLVERAGNIERSAEDLNNNKILQTSGHSWKANILSILYNIQC